jgi:hypothetical protein
MVDGSAGLTVPSRRALENPTTRCSDERGRPYGSLLKAGKFLLGVTTAHHPRRTWTGDLLEAGVELDTVQRMQRKAAAQLHVIR